MVLMVPVFGSTSARLAFGPSELMTVANARLFSLVIVTMSPEICHCVPPSVALSFPRFVVAPVARSIRM